MKTALFVLMSLSSSVALAAGGGGPIDLLIPLMNVAILGGVIYWKAKDGIVQKMLDWSDNVKETYERASSRHKESEIKLKSITDKLGSIDEEKIKISQEVDQQGLDYSKTAIEEAKQRAQKIQEESVVRAEAEKKKLVTELNGEIINQVISKAKDKINQEPQNRQKVSRNLLQRIGTP
jgi:F0F1-type ATP synthase membrane subunit b/b'